MTTAILTRRSKGEPLGYAYDPIPRTVEERIRAGTLKAIDERVLKQLLRFRKAFRNSCWTTKKFVARELGITEKTVQRSFLRLGTPVADEPPLIEQVAVPKPDPDEPANRTGWRIYLNLTSDTPTGHGPGPDRRPNVERRKWVRVDRREGQMALPLDPAREDTRALPPQGFPAEMSPPSGTSEGQTGGTPGEETGGTFMSPNLEMEFNPDSMNETPPSSSSPDTGEPTTDDDDSLTPLEEKDGPDGAGEAVEAARECFGDDLAGVIRADVKRIGAKIKGRWDCLAGALYMAHKVNPAGNPETRLGYVLRIAVTDFIPCGVSAEATLHRDKLRERRRLLADQAERERARLAEAERWARRSPRELIEAVEQLGWDMEPRATGLIEFVATPGRTQEPRPAGLVERLRGCKSEIRAILDARCGPTIEGPDPS